MKLSKNKKNIIECTYFTALFVLFVLSFCAYFSKYHYIFDIISQYRVLYCILSIIIFISPLFYINHNKKFVKQYILFSLLALLLNLFDVIYTNAIQIPYEFGYSRNNYKVYSVKSSCLVFNIHKNFEGYQTILFNISQKQPDIFIVENYSNEFDKNLPTLKKLYKYTHTYINSNNEGLAIYSKNPFKEKSTILLSNNALPILRVKLYNGVTIITLKMPKYISKNNIYLRNLMLNNLANYIRKLNTEDIIITGDFSTSEYTYAFKKFQHIVKLNEHRPLLSGTYPKSFPKYLRVSFDKVLSDKDICISDYFIDENIEAAHSVIGFSYKLFR